MAAIATFLCWVRPCLSWAGDPWEMTGYVHNVVFSCGAVADDDGSVKIYWGGADTVMCAGTARIDDLVDLCLGNSRPPY